MNMNSVNLQLLTYSYTAVILQGGGGSGHQLAHRQRHVRHLHRRERLADPAGQLQAKVSCGARPNHGKNAIMAKTQTQC